MLAAALVQAAFLLAQKPLLLRYGSLRGQARRRTAATEDAGPESQRLEAGCVAS